jgi:glutamate-1-semialdehyde 2,1-aminomutase
VPSIEVVRLVSSGTEAAMAAIRLARGATRRPKIVRFEGCHHGDGDSLLVRSGAGAASFGTPDSPGVTEGTARDTLTATFNDLESVRRRFNSFAGAIAAVIVEPVAANMGVVPPRPGFLEGLRELTAASGALLVFDETVSGFHLARGGAEERFGVRPDLTILGPVIGGGLPAAAYGGSRELMDLVAPAGPVQQSGPHAGNPVALAAGLAQLRAIEADAGLYPRLDALGAALEAGIADVLVRRGHPCRLARVGSMWTLFFSAREVGDWAAASRCDTAAYARFFHAMLARGVQLAPSQLAANFISGAHGSDDVEATLEAGADSLEEAFAAR